MAATSHRKTTATLADDDDDDVEVWLSVPTTTTASPLPQGLLDLERELRCPICQDFFHNPVSIVPCHHTFCSECIRTYFTGQIKSLVRKARCAACKCDVDTKNDKCYIPNRSVQRLVGIFAQRVRDPLLRVLRDGGEEKTNELSKDPLDSKQPPQRRTRNNGRAALDAEDIPPTNCTVEEDPSHQIPAEVSKLRSKRSKPHYAGKSKAQVKKLCRDEGLRTDGTEGELRQRHIDYIVLYNSECDSYTPRSVQALVDIIHEREHARAQQKRSHSFSGHQDISKLQLGDTNLAAGFQKMIQDLKEKKRKDKEAGTSKEPKSDSPIATSASLEDTTNVLTNDADDTIRREIRPPPSTPVLNSDPRKELAILHNSADPQSTAIVTASAVSTSVRTTTTRTEPPSSPYVTQREQLPASSPFPPAPPLPPPTVLTTSSMAAAEETSPDRESSLSSSKRKSPLGQSHLKFDKRPRKNVAGSSKRASTTNTTTTMTTIPSWTCDRCTFVNPAKEQQHSTRPDRSILKCEICATPRRSNSSSTSERVIEVG